MATEARPTFLAITGPLEVEALVEALAAARRFELTMHAALGDAQSQAVAAGADLAARAFGGDPTAWAPLVAAVRDLLKHPAPAGIAARRSRRELRAFVNENVDLLEC